MGLDTVELVYSFERYFRVEFPDAVSEKLRTVGDVATWLSQQLGVAGLRQSTVRMTVATQLVSELPLGTVEAALLWQLLPDAPALKAYRYALKNRYGLVLPPPSPFQALPAIPSLWERLSGKKLPSVAH